MIDLYYWTTPNGHKISIFLEESGLDYQVHPVNIGTGQQFEAEFLRVSPNNKIPAIVDHNPADGGESIPVFESGAILEYLADKVGRFLPLQPRLRAEVQQWLHWQMGGLGPMAGQNHHFVRFAPEEIPYAIDRYVKETARLYGVLDRQLAEREYVAGDYSIADMAIYPWARGWELQRQRLEDFPNMAAWLARMGARPAVQRALQVAEAISQRSDQVLTSDARKALFQESNSWAE